ncbi:MAG: class III signal peptide-containing protein [bacterium]
MKMEMFRRKLGCKRGQNTVEYLLMLTVVVAVVLIAGYYLKDYMPKLFSQVAAKIGGSVDQNADGSGQMTGGN